MQRWKTDLETEMEPRGTQTDMTKRTKQQDMRMANIYRLNEVLHKLIRKKHKGNKNIQQIDITFTFIILKLKISF